MKLGGGGMKLDSDSMVFALDCGSDGRAAALAPGEVEQRTGEAAWRWIHLDRTAELSRRWIGEAADLPELVREALFEEETRPRSAPAGDGVLVILRGVNLNPGAEPEDMVSLRLYADARSVISMRRHRVYAVQSIREAAEAGEGPGDTGTFLAMLADGLTSRLAETIAGIEERMDALEDESLGPPSAGLPGELIGLRREIVSYRRFLAPQREALAKLIGLQLPWLDGDARGAIKETLERLARVIDSLDAVRERAALLQESLANQAAERMNRTMYLLSVVAAVFLPLSFVTGLLGVNVGGMPGTQSSNAFAIVCGIIVLLVLVELWIFRRMRWF